jgi:hypothetical protein
MTENAKMDMQLSEEHLHAIAGGCSKCEPTIKRVQEFEQKGLEWQKKAGFSATLQEAEAHMKQAQSWYQLAGREKMSAQEIHNLFARNLPTTSSQKR